MQDINARLFLSKADVTAAFTPRLMQDLPMLIISPVSFSVFIYFIFCSIIYIIRTNIQQAASV